MPPKKSKKQNQQSKIVVKSTSKSWGDPEEEKLEESQTTEDSIMKTPRSGRISEETTPSQNDLIENDSNAFPSLQELENPIQEAKVEEDTDEKIIISVQKSEDEALKETLNTLVTVKETIEQAIEETKNREGEDFNIEQTHHKQHEKGHKSQMHVDHGHVAHVSDNQNQVSELASSNVDELKSHQATTHDIPLMQSVDNYQLLDKAEDFEVHPGVITVDQIVEAIVKEENIDLTSSQVVSSIKEHLHEKHESHPVIEITTIVTENPVIAAVISESEDPFAVSLEPNDTIIIEKLSASVKEENANYELEGSTGSYVHVLDREESPIKAEKTIVIQERKASDFKEVEKEVIFVKNEIKEDKIVTQVTAIPQVGRDDLLKREEKELNESYGYIPERETKHHGGAHTTHTANIANPVNSNVLSEFKPSEEKPAFEKETIIIEKDLKGDKIVTTITTITQKPAEEKSHATTTNERNSESSSSDRNESKLKTHEHERKEESKAGTSSFFHPIDIEGPNKTVSTLNNANVSLKKDEATLTVKQGREEENLKRAQVRKSPEDNKPVLEIQTKKEREDSSSKSKKESEKREDEPRKKKANWAFVIAGGVSTALAGFIISRLLFKLPPQKSLLASILVGTISSMLLKR